MKTLEELTIKCKDKLNNGVVNNSKKGLTEKEMIIVTTLPKYKSGKVIISEKLINKLRG